jgi:cation diffusion facilitator CzcD-associated flavoprotein CzcO
MGLGDAAGAHVRVAVIGAGAGGVGLGILLRRAGIDDFVIFEKGDGVGGTWRVNTYPGAECDVPSHLYSFSFLLNPEWTKTFAGQPEILDYLERCASETGVVEHVRTSTAIESITWDAGDRRWRLRTEHGDDWTAQVVVSAVGMFNAPAYPDLAGLDDFAGPVMHSARWDADVDLAGRRVAVIGTGASAIQIIPAIAPTVGHLDVYQRSAPWVMPRGDEPIPPDDQTRFAADVLAMRRHRRGIYNFYEGNTLYADGDPRIPAFEGYARSHLERSVPDPVLRAALTPDYPVGCKRILLSDDFYPTMQQQHVTLVTDRIDRLTSETVIAGGVERATDVVVLATGYRATDYLHGIEVVGRGGRRLHDDWADEPRAYLGLTVPGYPNLFTFYGPNTNQGGNSILLILEAQARYVVDALRAMEASGRDVLEVTEAAAGAYNAQLDADLATTIWTGCASYFRTPSGHIATQLPHPSAWYRRRARRIDLADYTPSPD